MSISSRSIINAGSIILALLMIVAFTVSFGNANADTAPTCPEGFSLQSGACVYTAVPGAPTCPEGYTQDGTECNPDSAPVEPTVCPPDFTLVGGECVAAPLLPTCASGLVLEEDVFSGSVDGCVSENPTTPTYCESGVLSQGECVVVAGDAEKDGSCFFPGSVYRSDVDKCVYASTPPVNPACQPGTSMGGDHRCYVIENVSCDSGFTYDDPSNLCTAPTQAPVCPANTEVEGELCAYLTISAAVCPAGYTLTESQCIGTTVEPTCPANSHLNEVRDQCAPDPLPTCASGFHVEGYTCVADPAPTPSSGGSSSGAGSSSGGGGSGGFSGQVLADFISPIVPIVPSAAGRVLGAETAKSCYQFVRTLAIGAQGSGVGELQKILIAKGYLKIDAPTGTFGPATEIAVKALQKDSNLEQAGVVGPKTRALLNACGSASSTTDAERAELIKSLKTQLDILLKKISDLMSQQ